VSSEQKKKKKKKKNKKKKLDEGDEGADIRGEGFLH
jgi:hypothetical protein